MNQIKQDEEIETTHCQLFLNKKLFDQLRLWKKINNSTISETISFFLDKDKLALFISQRLEQLKKRIDNGHDVLLDVYQEQMKE